MPIAWVTRHQGMGGTTAFATQQEAVEQYVLYLSPPVRRADLFRVTHEGDVGTFDVRHRIEGIVFDLPEYVPAGLALSVPPGVIVQHVLSSEA